MGEPGEGPPRRELQADFNALVGKFHRHAMDAFGPNGRFAGGIQQQDTPLGKSSLAQLASAAIFDFSSLYDRIPQGHHLMVGLTPLRYSGLSGDSDTQPLCEIENTEEGPRYWLRVGRRADRDTLAKGRSVLNITPVGTNDEAQPRIRFNFSLESKQGSKRVSPGIYPEDILSLKVVPNRPSS